MKEITWKETVSRWLPAGFVAVGVNLTNVCWVVYGRAGVLSKVSLNCIIYVPPTALQPEARCGKREASETFKPGYNLAQHVPRYLCTPQRYCNLNIVIVNLQKIIIGTSRTISPAISIEEARHSNRLPRSDLGALGMTNWLTAVSADLPVSTTPSSRVSFAHHVTLGGGFPVEKKREQNLSGKNLTISDFRHIRLKVALHIK